MKLLVPAFLVIGAALLGGCPEEQRKEVTDSVGGQAQAQVDEVQKRADRAERALQKRSNEADAAKE